VYNLQPTLFQREKIIFFYKSFLEILYI